ncbi:phosphohistidine phosphatase SixA [Porticoccus sp. W117]|uniref:phosphohistidine phosphatase SixA n=1 Tax=Porticoccus sp. W117 TaxID=3054777 RepID=UPI0025977968|nr:phosphohistidine phosphatase SixA [Porticoccus sp. W117]MDM3869734.1 phosphohistidine phosphatase SixA [Porticoccus sp. W117]
MKLYLLRHGDAAYDITTEGERPLTPLGISQTRQVIGQARDAMAGVDSIYCSPKLRARQTADIACEALGTSLAPEIIKPLLPEGNIHELEALIEQSSCQQILLVTHQPLVGEWINRLTDRNDLAYQMSTSCLACLDLLGLCRGGATLDWLKRP